MVSEVFFFCAWIQFVKTASKMNEVPSRHWSLPELVLLQFSNHLTLLPLPPKAHAASAGLAKETNDMKIVVLRRFLSK